jgi:transcriptional regulator with XRE-family HTH domain
VNIQEIIETLKKIRKQKGLTQKAISEKLNITNAQYAHYETGRSEMTINTFLKILEILEVNLNDFFNFQNNITKEDLINLQNNIEKLKEKIL